MSQKSPAKTHKQMVAEWQNNPEFVAAYDELETKYVNLRARLQMRQRNGWSQFLRQSPLHGVELDLNRSIEAAPASAGGDHG